MTSWVLKKLAKENMLQHVLSKDLKLEEKLLYKYNKKKNQ